MTNMGTVNWELAQPRNWTSLAPAGGAGRVGVALVDDVDREVVAVLVVDVDLEVVEVDLEVVDVDLEVVDVDVVEVVRVVVAILRVKP